MRRSGVRASPGECILASMFALIDICVLRYVSKISTGTFVQRAVLISQYRQRNAKVGSSSLPWSKFFCLNVCLVRYLCVPLILYELQWHSRLARRTKSQYRQRNAKVGSSSLPWSKYFSLNVCHVRYLCVPLMLYELQWHSRLARRTYKSVQTEKFEGREFEPPWSKFFCLNVCLLDICVFR